nr:hypothetical protein [Legionella wadsworthii]
MQNNNPGINIQPKTPPIGPNPSSINPGSAPPGSNTQTLPKVTPGLHIKPGSGPSVQTPPGTY